MNEASKNDDFFTKNAPQNGICAVFVTHNIGKRVLLGVESLLNQVETIIIVDNNSSDNSFEICREFANSHADRIEVVRNGVNNLANAQNIGIAMAKNKNAQFVLLMDHDSVAGEEMVEHLLAEYHNYSGGKIAIVAPNLEDKFSQRKAHYICHGWRMIFWRKTFGVSEILDNMMLAISSGSLIHMAAIEELGDMNEDFCIDQVDFEWCLRAISSGYKIIAVKRAKLLHQLGKCRDFNIFKMCVTTSNHNEVRRYYIYRNRLQLWRKYGLKIPAFVLFDSCAIAYDIFKVVFFEANRKAKLKAMFCGVRDTIFTSKNAQKKTFNQSIPIENMIRVRGI